ncbi:hypothetical protein [Paludibacterium yongneupense]|uniref:hypothetical protein n=1 Tax=Paludibacterium yongneupense TaxID=400061 RepID=UPI00048ED27E|nr:hypothetical protein [Paludibacterium yongneupense]
MWEELKQIREMYKEADYAEPKIKADPKKVILLIDAFLALWPHAQDVPLAVETDYRQDLMPLWGGPITVDDAATELRSDLASKPNQYNVAGAGHAVARALVHLTHSDYVKTSERDQVLKPYRAAILKLLDGVI